MKEAPAPEFDELKARFRPRWPWRLASGALALGMACINMRLADIRHPDRQDGPAALEWLAWSFGIVSFAVCVWSFVRLFLG